MNRLLLLGSIVCFTTALKAQIRYIDAGIFKVDYNESFEQPQRLWYNVQCTHSEFSRAGLNFFGVDSVHTSNNADYANNEWDKGHLAPAADFACDAVALRQTFSYLNCALQHESLNRGPWKALEDYERELAITGEVHIVVSLEFESARTLPTGATIPTHFTKTIEHNGHTLTYRFPNDDSVRGKPFTSFLIAD